MKTYELLIVLLILLIPSTTLININTSAFVELPPTKIIVNVVDRKTNATLPLATLKIVEKGPDGVIEGFREFEIEPPHTFPQRFIEGFTLILSVVAEGYKESEPFIYLVTAETPKEGVIINHTFYLDPLEPTRVYISITSPTKQPIKDANIYVTAIYVNETHVGKTNEKGVWNFTTRFENFRVYVSAEGYKPFEGKLKVLHNVTEMSYDIVLEYFSTVRFTIEVRDDTWNFVEGAKVTLSSQYGNFSKIAEKGIVEFEIPTAKYTLKVLKEGYQAYEEILDLSRPMVGGKVVQLTKVPSIEEAPWWQQYWSFIALTVAISVVILLVLRSRKFHEP